MQVFIKVRIKELAEEARIIWKEEMQAKEKRETSKLLLLHEHRVHKVRPAARAAQLAYGFLRGRPYRTIEQTVRKHNEPDLKEITRLVRKYGESETEQDDLRETIQAWLET